MADNFTEIMERIGNIKIPWLDEEVRPYIAGGIFHIFLVHGDITSLIPNQDVEDEPGTPFIPLLKLFEKIFIEREMVIFYNIADGIRFLKPEMEKKFRKVTGLEKEDKDTARDPVAAAKAKLAAKQGVPKEPAEVFPLIEKVLKSMGKVSVVIQSTHFIAPNSSSSGAALLFSERTNIERLKNWAADETMRRKGNLVFLLVEDASKVSAELRGSGSQVHQVLITKPPRDERELFIGFCFEQSKKYQSLLTRQGELEDELPRVRGDIVGLDRVVQSLKFVRTELSGVQNLFKFPNEFDIGVFSHATQGMGVRQILEAFQHVKAVGSEINLEYVKKKKQEILNAEYAELMEIFDPIRGLEDIAGHAHIKTYFSGVLDAIRKGEYRHVPMGVTLMGPPGTGKTAIVEALAKEAGFNFVKIKNIRSMWVGESESRMFRFIQGLKSLAPVVVMNDEADLAEGSRDAPKGDAGVSERLMKMWMEFLSDPRIRGKVIVISCTNRPDRLDPALKRSGRSDELILMPMPAREEMLELFRVMFKRHEVATDISDFEPFIKLVEPFSGADIEKITLKASRFAFEVGESQVNAEVLRNAIYDTIPSASQAEIDRMTLFGALESTSRRLLPKHINELIERIKARNLVENLPQMLEQIKARNIVKIDT